MATHLAVGQVRLIDGKPCLITDGYYLDPIYRRLSNWWEWRPIREDGTLGRTTGGYGNYNWKVLRHTKIIKVKL